MVTDWSRIPRDSELLQSMSIDIESRQILVYKKIELWKVIKTLSNKKIVVIVEELAKKPGMTFSELQNTTFLSVNELNHALYDMKNGGLVVRLDKKYYPTRLCAVVMCGLEQLIRELDGTSSEFEKMFFEGDNK